MRITGQPSRRGRVRLAYALAVVLTLTACPTDAQIVATPEPSEPTLVPPPTDAELASATKLALAGTQPGQRCARCHDLTASTLLAWLPATQRVEACITQATDVLACISERQPLLRAAQLGLFAAATHLELITALVAARYGSSGARVISGAAMPRDGSFQLTAEEFAAIRAYAQRGLPGVATLFPNPAPGPAPACSPLAPSLDLQAYLADTALSGWAAFHASNALRMHGCTPTGCFETSPTAADALPGLMGQSLPARVVATALSPSHYWTKSSADGRYVGQGAPDGSRVWDLRRQRKVAIAAVDDPGFADNEAFIFGTTAIGGAAMCKQALLDATERVTFQEASCAGVPALPYQQLGTPRGQDYVIASGCWSADSGVAPKDPDAQTQSSCNVRLQHMKATSGTYAPSGVSFVETPHEADPTISPNGGLLITRLGATSPGYVIRRLTEGPAGWQASVVSRLCVSGTKPSLSYDDRWLAFHHYEATHANVFLVDLATNQVLQVTNVPAGTYAVFPHFRADGWMYLVIKTPGTTREHIVAISPRDIEAALATPTTSF